MFVNPVPTHNDAPPGLAAWLDSVDGATQPTVRTVVIDGVACVIKRRKHGPRRAVSQAVHYVRALLLGLVCKLFLGQFPRPSILLRNDLEHEAQRLRSLAAAGLRVPALWRQEPDLLVLEHVGNDLGELLRDGDPAQRMEWVQAAALDMADFHARGMWHGGAQLRNVTCRDGLLWRIDFEENIGAALSLPLAQAYDVYQMLSSLMSMRRLDPQAMPEFGRRMLETYFQAHPAPQVKAELTRIGRLLAGSSSVLRPVLRHFSSRDIQGFLRVADLLRLLWKP